jgi:hypothetical protein
MGFDDDLDDQVLDALPKQHNNATLLTTQHLLSVVNFHSLRVELKQSNVLT